ncbi:uncharacterized protein [Amphiura filiformis]|uniref:uncharacterized protein n=1 Tax=Amphiura filiformis TaxID=82378 RepID=UPI003B22167C
MLHTPSYTHTGRVQNSDFQFPFAEVPAGTTSVTISIKGTAYAYLILSPTNTPVDDAVGDVGIPKIEIGRITSTGDMKTAYLCSSKDGVIKKSASPDILSATEYRDYTVSFANGQVDISVDGGVFFSQAMACLGDVKYIGVAAGKGYEADWKFCGYNQ